MSRDQMAAHDMVSRSGQMGVPVIIVDDQVVIGFNRPRLEALLAARAGGRPKPFGLRIADATRIAQKAGGVPLFGAYVGSVAPGSPAERAGLQPGDVVTELNMRPIRNADDLQQALATLQPGSQVRVTFLRGQQTMAGETTL
ncbi:MAG: PDZ domain-containing protein [Chloroflexi bacterium]|nr:PDZ domain-containing protein [Chloroflexota bacterium]